MTHYLTHKYRHILHIHYYEFPGSYFELLKSSSCYDRQILILVSSVTDISVITVENGTQNILQC
jgi:hypothetical protein